MSGEAEKPDFVLDDTEADEPIIVTGPDGKPMLRPLRTNDGEQAKPETHPASN